MQFSKHIKYFHSSKILKAAFDSWKVSFEILAQSLQSLMGMKLGQSKGNLNLLFESNNR